MNYTDVEAKVREATNDDPWGPTGKIEIFQFLWFIILFKINIICLQKSKLFFP